MTGGEEVRILEDEQGERSCQTCGVRYGSGKRAVEVGNSQAVTERALVCNHCTHHKSMGIIEGLGLGGFVKAIYGDVVDNWRPITDDDKSCQTCKVHREVCHGCRFNQYNRAPGTESAEDRWVNFEG